MSDEGDGKIRKIRAGLAEEGYGDATLMEWLEPNMDGDLVVEILHVTGEVPTDIMWRARKLAGTEMACWTCHGTKAAPACRYGDCTAGPDTSKIPPRKVKA